MLSSLPQTYHYEAREGCALVPHNFFVKSLSLDSQKIKRNVNKRVNLLSGYLTFIFTFNLFEKSCL